MAAGSIPPLEALEGVGNFIGVISGFLGGIVGIYFLSFIMKWVYFARILKILKDIKTGLGISAKKKKNEIKNKQRSSRKVS